MHLSVISLRKNSLANRRCAAFFSVGNLRLCDNKTSIDVGIRDVGGYKRDPYLRSLRVLQVAFEKMSSYTGFTTEAEVAVARFGNAKSLHVEVGRNTEDCIAYSNH